jgi:crotonobetainyl-CoA:carnitine CoA-transferase CaiB-like acyl-CoA transferase
LLKLAETVDAVVENSRVGVMDRAGIGYEVLRALKPSIVYAAVRGFGDPRTGASPYADWPAFDVVAQCMGGLVSMTGPADSTGYRVGPGIGDMFPGTLAALGVVSAVHAARRDGQGQFLDVAMYDAVLTLCDSAIYNYSLSGYVVPPAGNSSRIIVPFDIFPTSDGAVSIAAPIENHWALLCVAMDRQDLIADDRSRSNPRRVANAEFVRGLIAAWTQARTTREIVSALGGKVPVGPVNTAKDIFADPHARVRNMLVEVQPPGDNPPLTITGSPIKMTGTPAGIYARAPLLGEHSAEILAEAGLAAPSKPSA